MYTKQQGPRTEPCGTPQFRGAMKEEALPVTTEFDEQRDQQC